MASFAHNSYTNQASSLHEIRILNFNTANHAKLKQLLTQLSNTVAFLSLNDYAFPFRQLIQG